jgi:hypothetical protein
MSRPWFLGVGLGVLLAPVNVLANDLARDAQLLSPLPRLLTWAVQFLLVYASIYVAFRGVGPGVQALRARTRSAALALAVAAVICGVAVVIYLATTYQRPGPVLLVLSFFTSALVPLGLGGMLLAIRYSLALRAALAEPGARG